MTTVSVPIILQHQSVVLICIEVMPVITIIAYPALQIPWCVSIVQPRRIILLLRHVRRDFMCQPAVRPNLVMA